MEIEAVTVMISFTEYLKLQRNNSALHIILAAQPSDRSAQFSPIRFYLYIFKCCEQAAPVHLLRKVVLCYVASGLYKTRWIQI